MQLRDYQIDLVNDVYKEWKNGAQNVLLQLSTGGGKTVVISKIIADHREPAIAIAHRIEIVSQLSLTLARYGIRHNLIAQKPAIREIVAIHMRELNRSYYDPHSRVAVAGVDTLIRMDYTSWFNAVSLVVQDEGHHPLIDNKWGRAAKLFPNARGLYPTATPCRADGMGLGRHADGLIDAMVVGPPMRDLIRDGYLSEYRIFAPPSDLDLTSVTISATGDYSPPKLRTAVHKSHITGDAVAHYLRIAPGKLGVTFAVDIEAATEIAAEFRRNGVPAEVISSKTPDLLRNTILRRFKNREILQLVNVDLLGEGVDIPAIEVVSFCRPTASFCVYSQQFGRVLRPLPGKKHAIVLDHVGNVMRHGLPDAPRYWSLDRRERRTRGQPADVIPVRTCLNADCLSVYEAIHRKCPYCGHTPVLKVRSSPEHVDGDLLELDQNAIAKLLGEVKRIDGAPRVPTGIEPHAQKAVIQRHHQRQKAQSLLRSTIQLWAGYEKHEGLEDSSIYRKFYFLFGRDMLTAQALGVSDAEKLQMQVKNAIDSKINKSYSRVNP